MDDARILLNDSTLSPTHYALRIVPHDMNQLHILERDSSLIISYYPFEFEPISEEPDTSNGSCRSNNLIEECNETSVVDENSPVIYPIYVYWPISRSIPLDVEYDYCYDAFLPDNLDVRSTITGRLMTYDNRLGSVVPLGNIKLKYYQYYVFTKTTYTDENGYFTLKNATGSKPLSVILNNDKFAVRDSITSNIISISLGNLENYVSSMNYAYIAMSNSFSLDVFKAASYYFYSSNGLLSQVTRYDATGSSLDIYAINHSGEYLGCFYNHTTPYVCIWNGYNPGYYDGASSKIFGTVLHELGHATNRATVGQSQMINTDKVIKESFASFFGWYNVKEYYSRIAVSHSIVNEICTQGRQSWYPGTSSNINYTPLFIDLYDDYNQRDSLGSYCNLDTVTDVPVSVVLNFALGPTSFSNVYYPLASLIGTYYTGVEYSAFIAPYGLFLP